MNSKQRPPDGKKSWLPVNNAAQARRLFDINYFVFLGLTLDATYPDARVRFNHCKDYVLRNFKTPNLLSLSSTYTSDYLPKIEQVLEDGTSFEDYRRKELQKRDEQLGIARSMLAKGVSASHVKRNCLLLTDEDLDKIKSTIARDAATSAEAENEDRRRAVESEARRRAAEIVAENEARRRAAEIAQNNARTSVEHEARRRAFESEARRRAAELTTENEARRRAAEIAQNDARRRAPRESKRRRLKVMFALAFCFPLVAIGAFWSRDVYDLSRRYISGSVSDFDARMPGLVQERLQALGINASEYALGIKKLSAVVHECTGARPDLRDECQGPLELSPRGVPGLAAYRARNRTLIVYDSPLRDYSFRLFGLKYNVASFRIQVYLGHTAAEARKERNPNLGRYAGPHGVVAWLRNVVTELRYIGQHPIGWLHSIVTDIRNKTLDPLLF